MAFNTIETFLPHGTKMRLSQQFFFFLAGSTRHGSSRITATQQERHTFVVRTIVLALQTAEMYRNCSGQSDTRSFSRTDSACRALPQSGTSRIAAKQDEKLIEDAERNSLFTETFDSDVPFQQAASY